MLVLTRRLDAGDRSILCIGHDVTVTVLAIRGELVDLAVSAPAGIPVIPTSPVSSRRKPRQENNPEQNNPVPLDSPYPPML